ncbi:gonadotropin-releasing hormone receptor isoform X1 [Ixodes scapularis]|uniref:gonadotropin-releasing hormone receptor isoform X1 n=1 Tax=Ixodes scapularis TaxID=6945 RepID=UPI001A9DB91A|nr:gonadotropin-releasing hormone receptor isoform X1 [Ixodes scapularis]
MADNQTYHHGTHASSGPENASSPSFPLPDDLTFNTLSLVQVIVYSVLFVAAAAGNVSVFFSLFGERHRKSRIKLMILHLVVADLIVTFVMIPLEIIWRLTVQWTAGNVMCKVMQVLRAFGPYLSSMVLVCISVDRYFAVLHPFKVHDARRRGRMMLAAAWYTSLVCSSPQAFIFRVMEHPAMPGFYQCVTFAFFPSPWHERAYNLFCLLVLYGVPLAAIMLCYGCILAEIRRSSTESAARCPPSRGQNRKRSSEDPPVRLLSEHGGTARDRGSRYVIPECRQHSSLSQPDQATDSAPARGRLRLRRSDTRHIQRARDRTLRLTVIIVLAFFWCWTPYVTMVLWYQFDPDGAGHVNGYLQSSLFMFAVSNSCVNPLVYGSYTTSSKKLTDKVRGSLVRVRDGGRCLLCRRSSGKTVVSSPWKPTSSVVKSVEPDRDCCSLCSSDIHASDYKLYPVDGKPKSVEISVRSDRPDRSVCEVTGSRRGRYSV